MKKIKATDIGLVFIVISYTLLFGGFLSSCHTGTNGQQNIPEMVAKSTYDSAVKKDSILLAKCELDAKKSDTLQSRVIASAEYLLQAYNTEKALNKKLKDSLFQQNWRIVKAKRYIKIVQKNPHNMVFLIGWLNNQCFN